MLLHAHLIQVVELEFADTLNQDGELAAEEEILGLEVDLLIMACRRENVVSDAHVVDENFLEHSGLILVAEDLVLLERLQIVNVEVAYDL